jgi:hypothetical protein
MKQGTLTLCTHVKTVYAKLTFIQISGLVYLGDDVAASKATLPLAMLRYKVKLGGGEVEVGPKRLKSSSMDDDAAEEIDPEADEILPDDQYDLVMDRDIELDDGYVSLLDSGNSDDSNEDNNDDAEDNDD